MNKHLLSIDFEDWYTTNHYKSIIRGSQPSSLLEKPTYQILDILERTNTYATFFVLGSIAQRHPLLIQEIKGRGHEIASHGYSHTPLYNLTPKSFREEIQLTNKILEDIIQTEIIGFRAPFMSISYQTSWAIDILIEEKFKYDSSIFPMRTPAYGVSNAPKEPYYITSNQLLLPNANSPLLEVPLSVFSWNSIQFPVFGGIYSRFLPFSVFKKLTDCYAQNHVVNFYFHPWELIDKKKAGIGTSALKDFLANYNSEKYSNKIEWMLRHYSFTSFTSFFNL